MIHASTSFPRRSVRRATRSQCQAVGLDGFRLLGESVIDISPRGMLVGCDGPVEVGEDVVVSFRAPGEGAPWMDAEAQVARIVEGWRPGDPGYCMGLEFSYFESSSRSELLSRLAGLPPPVPQRRVRTARQRASERFGPVLIHGIIPLVNKKFGVPAYPSGVFSH